MATIRDVAKHAVVIVTIPLVLTVLLFQRRGVEGPTSGATEWVS